MRFVVCGATGFVGKAFTDNLLSRRISVTAIGRSTERIKKIFGDAVTPFSWEELEQDPYLIKGANVVVNLAGEPIAAKKWSPHQKEVIKNSRVRTTELVSRLCIANTKSVKTLINASAIGIYGYQASTPGRLPFPFDENFKIKFAEGGDFLAEVCREWEQATEPANNEGIRVVNIRIGHVLSPEGGMLAKLITPFKFFVGGPLGDGEQALSWISLTDLIRAIEFVINKVKIKGPVNMVSPNSVHQRELAKAVGEALNRPSFFRTPPAVLKSMFGEELAELLVQGQHVKPAKLIRAGFKFKDKEIYETVRSLLHSTKK